MPDWFDAAISTTPTAPPATAPQGQQPEASPPSPEAAPPAGAPARAEQPRDERGRFAAGAPPAQEEAPKEPVAEEALEAATPELEAEKPPEPRKLKVKLNVDGKEVEEEHPEEEVLAGFATARQKEQAANQRFEQAARATKQVQTILGALQSDPLSVIERLPGGVEAFVERLEQSAPAEVRRALGERLLGAVLDEQLLEKQNPGMARLMGEVRRLSASLNPQQPQHEEAPQEQPAPQNAEVQAHLMRLRPIFDGARQALGLQDTALAGALLGEAYQEARAKGAAPATPEALAQAAYGRLDGLLGALKPGDLAKRFPKVAGAVRQHVLSEAKAAAAKVAPRPAQAAPQSAPQPNGERKLMSTKDMDRALGM